MLDKEKAIFVAGHRGLAGSAIARELAKQGHTNIVTASRDELDLSSETEVGQFFRECHPAYVVLAAAKVGGIHANSTYPAEFLHDNLKIQSNVIHSAWKNGCDKLVFLGSSCIYPKFAEQPMREDALLTGPLEPTNEWYAIAKIAGIKMCQAYRRQYGFDAISLMPTNLYGPGDNFSLENSHVLPALIRKFHEAKLSNRSSVTLWGSGTPKREFLHVDDLGSAVVFLANRHSGEDIMNVGVGYDVSIRELAGIVQSVVGFEGTIVLDPTKPDGTPRKLMDVSRLDELGWTAQIGLEDGIRQTYDWYCSNNSSIRV